MQRAFAVLATVVIGCSPAPSPKPSPVPTAAASAPAPTSAPAANPTPEPPAFKWRAKTTAKGHIDHDAKPPSEAAWKTASKATVWGAEKAGCTARTTKGWLRVDCNAPLHDPPTDNLLTRGNGAWHATWDAKSFTVMLPIAEGLETSLQAGSGKEGVAIELNWRWKRPQPKVLGHINGAMIPRCDGKLPGAGAASEASIEDCRRSGHDTCDGLAKCLRGEPSHRPSCPAGWKFMMYCAYPCKADTDCAAGWACQAGADGSNVCLEK